MPTLTIHVEGKLRRRWALWLAVRLLHLVRVDIYADGKRIGRERLVADISEDSSG